MDVPTPTEAPRPVRRRPPCATGGTPLATCGAPLATGRVRCAVRHAPRVTRRMPLSMCGAARCAWRRHAPRPPVPPRLSCHGGARWVRMHATTRPADAFHVVTVPAPCVSGRHARRRKRPAATSTHGPCGADSRHLRPPPQRGRHRGQPRSLQSISPASCGPARRAARASTRRRRGARGRVLRKWGRCDAGTRSPPHLPLRMAHSRPRYFFRTGARDAPPPSRRSTSGASARAGGAQTVWFLCFLVWRWSSRSAAWRARTVVLLDVASAADADRDAARRVDPRARAARRGQVAGRR